MLKSILQNFGVVPSQRELKKNCKLRPSCKDYSPCKILTLGQKLKLKKMCQSPFFKSFGVVLCKKPLQKTKKIEK